jgi:hypothetical protein
MSTITFDTLQYVKTLKSAGFDDKQAEALAEAQSVAIDSATDIRLATKGDVQELKNEMIIMKWMLGTLMAGTGAIIMKLFFIH